MQRQTTSRVVTRVSLPREVLDQLRRMALAEATERGGRMSVSGVIAKLAREAAARPAQRGMAA